MDTPFQSVPKTAGVRPALQAMCPAVVRAAATREEWRDGCVGADVILEAKSGVSNCSKTHPCSEKLMTINESHTEFLG